jgi:DNA-nicking Smr family endonuclease
VKGGLDPADARLWATVAATVRPLPGRVKPASPIPIPAADPAAKPMAKHPAPASGHAARGAAAIRHPTREPKVIEPRRRHRLAAEREDLGGRIDLHGLDQNRARAALTDYLLRRHGEGCRSILVITGKGALGNGVLRRRVPEWLCAPPLQAVVAGLSEAHRRHGGEGALYVALKRLGGGAR